MIALKCCSVGSLVTLVAELQCTVKLWPPQDVELLYSQAPMEEPLGSLLGLQAGAV